MTQIKAVFFDLDETLVQNKLDVTELFKQVYVEFLNDLGWENRQVFFAEFTKRAKYTWANMFEHQESPERQLIECFEYGIAETKAVPSPRQLSLAQEMFNLFLSLSRNNVWFHPGAEQVLGELRSMGIVTGIITNGMEHIQLGKIEQLNLVSMVDHVTVSAQARAHKPLSAVFELALERAAVSAEVSMMVGDHPTNDVEGAKRAGLSGVYYNPQQLSVDHAFRELKEQPDHVISELTELLPLVR